MKKPLFIIDQDPELAAVFKAKDDHVNVMAQRQKELLDEVNKMKDYHWDCIHKLLESKGLIQKDKDGKYPSLQQKNGVIFLLNGDENNE